MSEAITIELQFFLISILWGAILLLIYDFLRIFRRIISHNYFFISVEDLIFWVASSVYIFAMIYKENNGIIRGFSIMGMTIGMLLYHFMLSDLIVKLALKLILAFLRPALYFMSYIRKVLASIQRFLKKANNYILLRLKRTGKSVKIALAKRKQNRLKEREIRKEKKKIRKQNRKEKNKGQESEKQRAKAKKRKEKRNKEKKKEEQKTRKQSKVKEKPV